MQAAVPPAGYEQRLPSVICLALAAAYKAGHDAGQLHAAGDHASENVIADDIQDRIVEAEKVLTMIGARLDGLVLAEQLAAAPPESWDIPGDWRIT